MKTNLDGYLNDILVVMCKFRNYKAEIFKVDRKSMQLENSSQFGHVDFLRIWGVLTFKVEEILATTFRL